MDNLIFAIILSIIQGITEWLPISSSGHLALFQNIFSSVDLTYDIFLHFASIFAIILIFYKDLLNLADIRKKENLKYIGLLLLATIPAAFVGFAFSDLIEKSFSNLVFLGVFFMVSGLIVYSTKFAKRTKNKITFFDALFIGLFQAIAIFPGISRSGATISSSLIRGIDKEKAIRFSFFLAIIIILGASLVHIPDITTSKISYLILIVSFIVTFLVSFFTIKFLLKLIRRDLFWIFGIYNFLLGFFILLYKLIVFYI